MEVSESNNIEARELSEEEKNNFKNNIISDEIINAEPEGTISSAKKGDMNYFDKTTLLTDNNGNRVWIPGGFRIHEESSTDVNKGIVITDGTNEFVWIPVDDATASEMYVSSKPVKLSNVDVETNIYSKLRVREGENYYSSFPGDTDKNKIKEPDVLINNYNFYDSRKEYYNTLGYSSDEEMAEKIVEEYINTYNSIKEYKGFYVGRYELTGTIDEPTVKKKEKVINSQNWYSLKKACNNIVNTEFAKSIMIYGNQWDTVMSWLVKTGARTESEVYVDSRTWGNYIDSKVPVIDDEGYVTFQVAGRSDDWKANNIFDLAGNYYEWTQEEEGDYGRVFRSRRCWKFWSKIPCSNA